jgi:nitrite reductase/ring-hydroxylating ferredoxin subunit
MERRRFLRAACQACAALATLPAATLLDGCAPPRSLRHTVRDGVLLIPLGDLSPGVNIIRARGLPDKLLIDRRSDDTHMVLVLNCPHRNGPVSFTDGKGLKCEWHGSTFDLDGNVTKGPSSSGLKRCPASVEGGFLRIAVG